MDRRKYRYRNTNNQWHDAGELLNLAAGSNPAMALATEPCVKTYCRGEHEETLPVRVWVNLPEHVILDHHLPRILEGLDPLAAPGVVQATEGVAYLPDMSFSHVGMPYFCNDWQVRARRIFVSACNSCSASACKTSRVISIHQGSNSVSNGRC